MVFYGWVWVGCSSLFVIESHGEYTDWMSIVPRCSKSASGLLVLGRWLWRSMVSSLGVIESWAIPDSCTEWKCILL